MKIDKCLVQRMVQFLCDAEIKTMDTPDGHTIVFEGDYKGWRIDIYKFTDSWRFAENSISTNSIDLYYIVQVLCGLGIDKIAKLNRNSTEYKHACLMFNLLGKNFKQQFRQLQEPDLSNHTSYTIGKCLKGKDLDYVLSLYDKNNLKKPDWYETVQPTDVGSNIKTITIEQDGRLLFKINTKRVDIDCDDMGNNMYCIKWE